MVFNHYLQTVPEAIRYLVDFPGAWRNPAAWITPWPWLRFTPLRLLVNGHAAVVVFFLLSGFVLALPVTKDFQPRLADFFVRRFCRVYLPFFVTIVLAWAVFSSIALQPNSLASAWFNERISGLPAASLAEHLLMTGDDVRLNPVMWSLVHEMRMVVFLPLIFLSIRRVGTVFTLFWALLVSVAATPGINDANANTSWQATGHFLWMFAAGSCLAFKRKQLAGCFSSAKKLTVLMLWLLTILLLAIPFDRSWSNFPIGGGGIMLIVLSLQEGGATTLLTSSIPLWLGRVSYSLYLIHLPILVLALCIPSLSLPLVFVATLFGAELACRLIEMPSHRLGTKLAQSLKAMRMRRALNT